MGVAKAHDLKRRASRREGRSAFMVEEEVAETSGRTTRRLNDRARYHLRSDSLIPMGGVLKATLNQWKSDHICSAISSITRCCCAHMLSLVMTQYLRFPLSWAVSRKGGMTAVDGLYFEAS